MHFFNFFFNFSEDIVIPRYISIADYCLSFFNCMVYILRTFFNLGSIHICFFLNYQLTIIFTLEHVFESFGA